MDGRIPEQMLIPKLFIEFLGRELRISLTFNLDNFKQLVIETSGSSPVGAFFGFEGIESPPSEGPQPGLHSGDGDFSSAIVREFVIVLGLFPEVLVLSPGGFGQHRGNDLVAFDGDSFSGVFFHEGYLLEGFLK